MFFWIVIYIVSLSTINDFIYKNLCVEFEDKNVHVNYLNDKFIFIDNWNIVKIEEVEWFLNSDKCNP